MHLFWNFWSFHIIIYQSELILFLKYYVVLWLFL